MSKLLSIVTISALSIILTACGGGSSSSSIADKNYIVVLKEVPTGVCESQLYRDTLEGYGLEGVVTEETDTSSNCETYGKTNDGETCIEESYGTGDVNCIIGFDSYNGDEEISYRGTNEAKTLDLHTLDKSLLELFKGTK